MRKLFASFGLALILLVEPCLARPATIFDYSSQLKLQAGQTQELRSLLDQLRQSNQRLQTTLIREEQEFRRLVKAQAELGLIREQLKKIQSLRIELRMLDITMQRKLETVLSVEQRSQWRSIQETLVRKPGP